MINIDQDWDKNKRQNEAALLAELIDAAALGPSDRRKIVARAADLVTDIRARAQVSTMEAFLGEYGLSTDEGVALMCLAEAFLRVPDAATMTALIEDKIAHSNWSAHINQSASPLVNASTWGLMLTGKVMSDTDPSIAGRLQAMMRRLGEPVIRAAIGRAMKEMGRQFVLGQDIDAALKRARGKQAEGFTYSYDMLGEAALTTPDAARYAEAYRIAIDAIAAACPQRDIAANPGISIKLSALHPRYEVAKTDRVLRELVPVVTGLARKAAKAKMGLSIDAEEMDRLALSLKVIQAVISDPALAGWDGFGVVVQAYGRRAGDVIDSLYQMALRHDRKIMIRLVKGAYWDTEIKHAQVGGLSDFPVFTRKAASDVSYLALARKLLGLTDRIYPQFATHNAHSVAAILEMAKVHAPDSFEFQRLHGMGEAVHDIVLNREKTRCRIYAPVGSHRDLLAYLVRRLMENGANSSFVNQVVDSSVPPEIVAACPFEALAHRPSPTEPVFCAGPDLFQPERPNSTGFDLHDVTTLAMIDAARPVPKALAIGPILAGPVCGAATEMITNPATGKVIGTVTFAAQQDVETAFDAASVWDVSAAERARVLNRAADLYEADFGTLFGLLASEAGKTLADAVAELREAVDFLRYYAAGADNMTTGPRGIFTCISPWNFPLAIFTGQVAAALSAGNAVLAKPAETTPAIAAWGVKLLHQAGVPANALQLLTGLGIDIGAALTSDARIKGVAFTGSTATAREIQRAMAENCAPGTPLIAETGGLNAMIVDSTALPERAVQDIIASAFQSAGQRCSALRCLYVQEDIAPAFLAMLIGAMEELELGDPWHLPTDVGPVITAGARDSIICYIETARAQNRVIHQMSAPTTGYFVGPTLVRVAGIADLGAEVFGPVLHVATFKAVDFGQIIDDVNATGYGLTFGLHTRLDDRVDATAKRVTAGNIYVNRNQIGAVVGSQPFGGEGLSGTGPKAGGPHYLTRFAAPVVRSERREARAANAYSIPLEIQNLPGPTGELNRLELSPRPPLLCLGPGSAAIAAQTRAVENLGGRATCLPARPDPGDLTALSPFGGLLWWGDEAVARHYAIALSQLPGPIVPLITGQPDKAHTHYERHLCVDLTSAGGNVGLLEGRQN